MLSALEKAADPERERGPTNGPPGQQGGKEDNNHRIYKQIMQWRI